ncbi:MAG TPA: metallopeptidase TldD-related protein, partial [Solirubrobacteraceae bacterium]|nr:metallopeptidase TldD-related protein [Solirubrobacteraceae bacterium]
MAATRDDLLALAGRALSLAGDGEAQATAWWERQHSTGPAGAVTSEAVSVEVAVLRDGRVGLATTTDVDEEGLARAGAGAGQMAARGQEVTGALPEPAPGRPHEGFDAAVQDLDPAAVELDEWSSWRAAAARTAIASSRGVRAYEERSFGELRVRRHGVPGRSLELTATAVSPLELDAAALVAEADRLLGGGEDRVAGVDAGEYPVVLGPWAVAEVLRRAALSFGGPWSPVADRLGTRVAASAVNLSDSPRFAATLPRSFDAEGSP